MIDLDGRPKASVVFQHVTGPDLVSVNFWH
jgi:hypothetical protein